MPTLEIRYFCFKYDVQKIFYRQVYLKKEFQDNYTQKRKLKDKKTKPNIIFWKIIDQSE